MLACPAMLALICMAVANLDRRHRLRTVLALPMAPRRVWWAKCVECWLLLLGANLCTWLLTFGGMSLLHLAGPSLFEGLATALSVTVMLAWMVPVGLWLSTWLGALAGIAVPFLIQVGCSILMYDAVIWWLVPPSGVLRVIAPLAGVMPDGSPLVRGSAYSQFGLACWLALIVGAIASILLAWLTGRWFNHREAR